MCFPAARGGTGRTAAAVAASRQPGEEAPSPHARRDRVSLALRRAGPLARSPRTAVRLLLARRLSGGLLRAGRIKPAPFWRQFQLAGTDLVSGELPDHRIAAEISSLLRRRFQDRMPDQLR